MAGGDFFASSNPITLTFTTGPTTPVGDWLMTAYGQRSDRQAVAAFSVTE